MWSYGVGVVEKWRSKEVEKWRSGEVEKWRSGEVEKWRSGGVEEWRKAEKRRSGGVEEWRSGGVEEWRKVEKLLKRRTDADVGYTEDGRDGQIRATKYAGGNKTRKEVEKRNV